MTTLYLLFGLGALLGICWLAVEAGLLKKTPYQDDGCNAADDRRAAEIVAASRPMPLEATADNVLPIPAEERVHWRRSGGNFWPMLLQAPPPPSDVAVGKFIRAVQQQARDAEQP